MQEHPQPNIPQFSNARCVTDTIQTLMACGDAANVDGRMIFPSIGQRRAIENYKAIGMDYAKCTLTGATSYR